MFSIAIRSGIALAALGVTAYAAYRLKSAAPTEPAAAPKVESRFIHVVDRLTIEERLDDQIKASTQTAPPFIIHQHTARTLSSRTSSYVAVALTGKKGDADGVLLVYGPRADFKDPALAIAAIDQAAQDAGVTLDPGYPSDIRAHLL